jgi:hypothetical protein
MRAKPTRNRSVAGILVLFGSPVACVSKRLVRRLWGSRAQGSVHQPITHQQFGSALAAALAKWPRLPCIPPSCRRASVAGSRYARIMMCSNAHTGRIL